MSSIRFAFVALLAFALAGCLAPADFNDGRAIRAIRASPDDLAVAKTVYFATTRCNDKTDGWTPGSADELFGLRCWDWALKNEEMRRLSFGMGEGAGVTCGSAAVTVVHVDGDKKAATNVEVPVSYDCTDNFETLRRVVLNAPQQRAIVFVHGYNTTLGFGLKRTAQLSYDLSNGAVPIMFSFGAAGRLFDYLNDTEAAELAAPSLQRLLAALARADTDGAPKVDVIAHSMGARLTLRALSEGNPPTVRRVVLAAADVDPAAFLRLGGKAVKRTERLTIYTAEYDVALSTSQGTHGRPRVGAGLAAGVAGGLGGLEIVDATARATDPYAHSYFAESEVVLNDIRGALAGTPAAQRLPPSSCTGAPPGVVACKIPCPEGKSCSPSLYARFVHWLFD